MLAISLIFKLALTVGGIGALLWGISADFYPVRRLLIALAGLSLPAAGLLWPPDWQAVGMLLMWLVLGGLISLTWMLMAESLPENHFAKLVLAITWTGYLVLSLESLLLFWAIDVWDRYGFFGGCWCRDGRLGGGGRLQAKNTKDRKLTLLRKLGHYL